MYQELIDLSGVPAAYQTSQSLKITADSTAQTT
jgi:hypothetical protein